MLCSMGLVEVERAVDWTSCFTSNLTFQQTNFLVNSVCRRDIDREIGLITITMRSFISCTRGCFKRRFELLWSDSLIITPAPKLCTIFTSLWPGVTGVRCQRVVWRVSLNKFPSDYWSLTRTQDVFPDRFSFNRYFLSAKSLRANISSFKKFLWQQIVSDIGTSRSDLISNPIKPLMLLFFTLRLRLWSLSPLLISNCYKAIFHLRTLIIGWRR